MLKNHFLYKIIIKNEHFVSFADISLRRGNDTFLKDVVNYNRMYSAIVEGKYGF